jgi:tRNA nucleotidyltransferase/poly(A) polymerase
MTAIATPPEISMIARRLQGAGYAAVCVGGSVRDSLLGRVAKDWDLATDATPEQVSALFPGVRATTRFGTALVPGGPDGQIVEITTFRTEAGYSDFRRPDHVAFTGSLRTDLERRDFTMNAIAYDPVKDTLLDPFGGVADLRARRIKAVGDPAARFGEDALRLLRATRFAASLGFVIEPNTAAAITKCAPLARHLARERVGIELAKTVLAAHGPAGLRQASSLGLLEVVLPELAKTVGLHGANSIARLPVAAARDGGLRWAALLHHTVNARDGVRPRLLELGLGEELADRAQRIVRAYQLFDGPVRDEPALRRALRPFARPDFEAGFRVRLACDATAGPDVAKPDRMTLARRARIFYAGAWPRRMTDLAIGGDDLAALGLRPGPAYGALLRELLEAVTDGKLTNTRPVLLAAARARLSKT